LCCSVKAAANILLHFIFATIVKKIAVFFYNPRYFGTFNPKTSSTSTTKAPFSVKRHLY